MTNQVTITPMIEQYKAMKKNHPDAILLFRVGDFYETFSDDAIAVSEICGVTLTRRMNGDKTSVELAGFPHHALDTYLPKIVRAGKRVAICEQPADPKAKKTTIREFDVTVNGYDYGKYQVHITADKITAVSIVTRAAFNICYRENAKEVCAYTNNIEDVVTRYLCRQLDGAKMLDSEECDGVIAEKWDLTECFPKSDKYESEEKATPDNKETSTKTNKAEKKMETKKINCNLSDEQLRELGEPVAYFNVEIPKEVKNMGKYTKDAKTGGHAALQAVCLEPENGKLIASDTRILYTAAIRCDGSWPAGDNNRPFQCFIDPKAIRELAGKTVDIAVWLDESDHQKVTACEAAGVLTQHSIPSSGMGCWFPDWKRVMSQDTAATIRIAKDAVKPLREFLKANMGKNKAEREGRFAVVHVTPEADDMQVRIMDLCDGDLKEVAVTYADLENRSERYILQSYDEQLFYYSVLEDFGGEISFAGDCRPATFKGECRTSLLMPKNLSGLTTYLTTEKPESK